MEERENGLLWNYIMVEVPRIRKYIKFMFVVNYKKARKILVVRNNKVLQKEIQSIETPKKRRMILSKDEDESMSGEETNK